MEVTIITNIGTTLRPISEPVKVTALEIFELCGLRFAVHRMLGEEKRFTCTELSTGRSLTHSGTFAGNGNFIPGDRRGFVAYCKENIPLTSWLHESVACITASEGVQNA